MDVLWNRIAFCNYFETNFEIGQLSWNQQRLANNSPCCHVKGLFFKYREQKIPYVSLEEKYLLQGKIFSLKRNLFFSREKIFPSFRSLVSQNDSVLFSDISKILWTMCHSEFPLCGKMKAVSVSINQFQ